MLGGFVAALGLGLVFMLAILVLLFSALRQPLVIMLSLPLSLPLSLTGAILAMFATATTVNLPVVIGILMLMGIVAKNGIMLVDFAEEGIRHGMTARDAIVHACRTRARPIIMTTIAMTAGMVPSSLALGGGAAIRAPMAIVVMGGRTFSTLLSLVTIPALYLLAEDCVKLTARMRRPREPLQPARDDGRATCRCDGAVLFTRRSAASVSPVSPSKLTRRIASFLLRG
ncbi:efflux RND transporter permease subunit [Ensifer sp. 4252]|uniref:efflux RND transporter permease subunit n=1 Tax=Ensifer sp. 4252 TaxID=3373915 RepID=UPI003D205E40